MLLALALALSLTPLPVSADKNEQTCYPHNSKPQPRIRLADGANGSCHFPFEFDGRRWHDCALEKNASVGGVRRYWCPTTCNLKANPSTTAYCLYTLRNMSRPNCYYMPSAAPSQQPPVYRGSGNGTGCVFPFLLNGICHKDCVHASDGQPWCPTTREVALQKHSNRKCVYSFAGIRSRSCSQLNATKQYRMTRFSPSYYNRIQTDPDGNCTFPFYFRDKCYDDCTYAGGEWYAIWCSTEKFFGPNMRWRYCPHYRRYRNVKIPSLGWGFYRVRVASRHCGDASGAFCNASVVPAGDAVPKSRHGSRRLGLSRSESPIWEFLPQPNVHYVVRFAVDCGAVPVAWSVDATEPTAESLAANREFWKIDAAVWSGEGEFRILSSQGGTAEMTLTPRLHYGHPVLRLIRATGTHDTATFRIEEISNSEKAQLRVCDKPPVYGEWCPWSGYEMYVGGFARSRRCSCPAPSGGGADCVGEDSQWNRVWHGQWCGWTEFRRVGGGLATRRRVCGCPRPSNGGNRCPGNATERRPYTDGSWCPWGSFSRESNSTASRQRGCGCPSPANGGRICPGRSEERRRVEHGRWCAWSSVRSSSGRLVTRTRSCSCPEPKYDGFPCEGVANQTGAVVNGNWCRWSPLLGNRRTRDCKCPAPAFGGSACEGPSEAGPRVHGQWCEWTEFSPSADGWESRSRECKCPAPASGGEQCFGDAVEWRLTPTEVWSGGVSFTTVFIIAGVVGGLLIICLAVAVTRRKDSDADTDSDRDYM